MPTSLISTGSYQAYPQFLGTNQPYILPATFTYNGDQNINIPSAYGNLPPLGKSDANILVDTNPPAGSRANTDFQLSWIAGSITPTPTGTTEPTTIAQITIKGNNCWKLDKPSRQQLRTSWAVFSDKLDALEMKGYLFTGSAAIILQRIAEALPLSFKEMLTYRYNFNPSDRYIDLQAGMRLRVDFAAQQFIAPGSNINGFVGAGTSYYELCQIRDINGNPRLTFDAFSGNMAAMDMQLPLGGIASVVDLQGIDTSRRYWRLFYPAQIPSNVGNNGIAQNVTIIGANTLAILNAATQAYLTSRDVSSVQDCVALFFRGRTVVIPEILIYLNNSPIYVPIGTTVRNIFDRYLNNSFTIRYSNSTSNNIGMQVNRAWTTVDAAILSYKSVAFLMLSKDAPATMSDAYDLPLVKGDVLSFNKPS